MPLLLAGWLLACGAPSEPPQAASPPGPPPPEASPAAEAPAPPVPPAPDPGVSRPPGAGWTAVGHHGVPPYAAVLWHRGAAPAGEARTEHAAVGLAGPGTAVDRALPDGIDPATPPTWLAATEGAVAVAAHAFVWADLRRGHLSEAIVPFRGEAADAQSGQLRGARLLPGPVLALFVVDDGPALYDLDAVPPARLPTVLTSTEGGRTLTLFRRPEPDGVALYAVAVDDRWQVDAARVARGLPASPARPAIDGETLRWLDPVGSAAEVSLRPVLDGR